MKQLIIMIAMIMLGIAIAGMISRFSVKADVMTNNVMTSLDEVTKLLDGENS